MISTAGTPVTTADVPVRPDRAAAGLTVRQVHGSPSPVASWAELLAGNLRYASDHPQAPRRDQARRTRVVSGQFPFALVFGCADSRVPAEILFDQGLGDLFVIRTAGHVLGPGELGSLEYAVDTLNVPLIAVLAHDGCGAVGAAISVTDSGQMPDGHVRGLLEGIIPAVRAARDAGMTTPGEIESAHARAVMSQIPQRSPIVAARLAAGTLALVTLKYQLADGTARLIDGIGQLGVR